MTRTAKRVESGGFTLLEVLLVLLLMAMGVIAVIGTLPPRQDEAIQQAAQSLFQRIRLLNEEAMLAGKDFGLSVDETTARYQFMVLSAQGWQTLTMPRVQTTTTLTDGVVLHLAFDAQPSERDSWFKADDDAAETTRFAVENDSSRSSSAVPLPAPQILLLASGEITPARLTFYPQGGAIDDGWQVVLNENGSVQLQAAGESETAGEHDES